MWRKTYLVATVQGGAEGNVLRIFLWKARPFSALQDHHHCEIFSLVFSLNYNSCKNYSNSSAIRDGESYIRYCNQWDSWSFFPILMSANSQPRMGRKGSYMGADKDWNNAKILSFDDFSFFFGRGRPSANSGRLSPPSFFPIYAYMPVLPLHTFPS